MNDNKGDIRMSDIETISLKEAADLLGMKEKTLIKKIRNGEIIAAEYGGRGKPTGYDVFRSSLNAFLKGRTEEKEKKKSAEEEKVALENGRKIIDILCTDEMLPEGFPIKDFKVTWKDEMKEYTFEKLFNLIAEQYQIDVSFVKNFDIECERVVYKLSDKLEKCTFIRIQEKDDVFFICPIELLSKKKEEKKDVNVNTVKINTDNAKKDDLDDVNFEDTSEKGLERIIDWYDDQIYSMMDTLREHLSQRDVYMEMLAEKSNGITDVGMDLCFEELEDDVLSQMGSKPIDDGDKDRCNWGKKCSACTYLNRIKPDFPMLYCGKYKEFLYAELARKFSLDLEKDEQKRVDDAS